MIWQSVLVVVVLLSVYLFRFQLHLLFIFATMIMVNKDYQQIVLNYTGSPWEKMSRKVLGGYFLTHAVHTGLFYVGHRQKRGLW